MKQFITVIFLLLLPCLCLAQGQGANNDDYRFIIDQTPFLEMQFPKRNDIPKDGKVFYALSYDKYSFTAFIYNEYVCGYYEVPHYMQTGFETGAKNLQGQNPKEYNNRVESIMNRITTYWQKIDSLKNSQTRMVYSQDSLEYTKDDKVYDVVEQMPSFPSGMAGLMAYLQENIKFPSVAEENNIQGIVVCSFIVLKDGTIANVRVVKSIDPTLDEEALRVIKAMPKWNPGKQNGVPVNVKYTFPIAFRLQ
jgi:TonB family protein